MNLLFKCVKYRANGSTSSAKSHKMINENESLIFICIVLVHIMQYVYAEWNFICLNSFIPMCMVIGCLVSFRSQYRYDSFFSCRIHWIDSWSFVIAPNAIIKLCNNVRVNCKAYYILRWSVVRSFVIASNELLTQTQCKRLLVGNI